MKINNLTPVGAKVLEIYDPALCCSSGVCGVDADQVLIQFSADIDWLKQQGIEVKRFNLAQEPMAFANQAVIKDFLQQQGADKLPAILLGGQIKMSNQYPSRQELATWFGLTVINQGAEPQAQSNCCQSSGCC
ncbi:arsenite efflux transporter metallochaperone ArsD [Vibrio aphrogenes]|uniref:arsenite efflux transporter metallochaperone ArsD n=1 Tax=Vibrio aphrogenes TaxID=1891186 RepID=UPI000B34D37A|nr:arsenite efflux transporter metallochaperone ArsD [Vibrio aphrogenes]